MKSCSSHTQVDVGTESYPTEVLKQSVSMCEQHKGREIEVFCRDCKVVVCMMCVITSHKTHDCLDIEEVAKDLRKLVLSDTLKVAELWKST